MTDLREQIASTICGDRAVDNWDATDADYETADAILELLKGAVKPLEWDEHPDGEGFYALPDDSGDVLYVVDKVSEDKWRLFIGALPVKDPEREFSFMFWKDADGAKRRAERDLAERLDRMFPAEILAALGVK